MAAWRSLCLAHAPTLFDRWVLANPSLFYGDDWALLANCEGRCRG